MALSRDQVAQLYTPIYDKFMLATFNERTQVHTKVFTSIEDKTKEYKTDELSGLGEWVDGEELVDGGWTTPVLGYAKTYTQAKHEQAFSVSFEALDQDEYALLKKQSDAKMMGRGARAKVEKKTSAILYGGFTTAGPDGQYLFDTDHPKNREETGITYSNLLSGPFSHDNLELAEKKMADNFKDMTGIPIEMIERPVLLYAPAIKGIVERVLSDRAVDRPGTNNRDINIFAGRYDPQEWIYLSANMGGSDTAWYVLFPELEFLKIIWSKKPYYMSWVEYRPGAYCFKGSMLFDCGADDWRCGFASTGL